MAKITRQKISTVPVSQNLKTNIHSDKLCGGISESGTVILKDHSKLTNLEYLKSGHTGFAGIEFGTTAE